MGVLQEIGNGGADYYTLGKSDLREFIRQQSQPGLRNRNFFLSFVNLLALGMF
jgi:hypothetical protein